MYMYMNSIATVAMEYIASRGSTVHYGLGTQQQGSVVESSEAVHYALYIRVDSKLRQYGTLWSGVHSSKAV